MKILRNVTQLIKKLTLMSGSAWIFTIMENILYVKKKKNLVPRSVSNDTRNFHQFCTLLGLKQIIRSPTRITCRNTFLIHDIIASPVDTGRKLNVHKTFRRRPGRLLNVLCTFNLRPVSTGVFFHEFHSIVSLMSMYLTINLSTV